jgi:hypothetical protein
MEVGAVGHNFERDPPRDHPCQDWFNLVQRFLRRRFKCDLLSTAAILNGGRSEQKVTTLDKDLARNISTKYGSNPSSGS